MSKLLSNLSCRLLLFLINVIRTAARPASTTRDQDLLTKKAISVTLMTMVGKNSYWTHAITVCEWKSVFVCVHGNKGLVHFYSKNAFHEISSLCFLHGWNSRGEQWMAWWILFLSNVSRKVALSHLNVKMSVSKHRDIWTLLNDWWLWVSYANESRTFFYNSWGRCICICKWFQVFSCNGSGSLPDQ